MHLQVLLKLAQASPGAVLAALDSLIEPLDKTVLKKLPAAAASASASSSASSGADSAAAGGEAPPRIPRPTHC